jgi:hypothetical protein
VNLFEIGDRGLVQQQALLIFEYGDSGGLSKDGTAENL